MVPVPQDALSDSDMDLSVIPNEITTIIVKPKGQKKTSVTGRQKLLGEYDRRIS